MAKLSPAEREAVARQKRQDARLGAKAKALERLEVVYVPIDALRPNEYNPNRQSEHDFQLLILSMQQDGFTTPVVANRDGQIVDGEHRWRAAATLGITHVPVVYVDMTPEQMRVSTIRHNRARGSHDVGLEAEVIKDLQRLGVLDWAQDALLLDDVEIQRLIGETAGLAELESDD